MVKNIPTIERSTKIRFGKHATDDQAENTIVINASDSAINAINEGSIYMAPLRVAELAGSNLVGYSSFTKELVDSSVPTTLLGGVTLDSAALQGNIVSNAIPHFANTLTAFTTGHGSNVGISNTAPTHMLSVGDKIFMSNTGAEAIKVVGNVRAERFFSGSSVNIDGNSTNKIQVSGIIKTGALHVDNIGIANTSPTHALSLGNEGQLRLNVPTGSIYALETVGNVSAQNYIGDGGLLSNVTLQTVTDKSNVTSNTLLLTNPTTSLKAYSNVIVDGNVYGKIAGSNTIAGSTITASTQFSGPGTGLTGIPTDQFVSGAIALSSGGTGQTSYASGTILYGKTSGDSLGQLNPAGSNADAGKFLRLDSSDIPEWAEVPLTLDAVLGDTTAVSDGSMSLTDTGTTITTLGKIKAATFEGLGSELEGINASNLSSGTLTTTVLPVVPVTKGGTSLSSVAAGDILYAPATNQIASLAKGTANKVLQMDSGATIPEWTSTITGATLSGPTLTGTITATGLSNNRIPFTNGSGELVSDTKLQFDGVDTMTIGSNLTISGNLLVQGNTTFQHTQNHTISDPLIELGNANASDTIDLGVIMTRPTANVVAGYMGDEKKYVIAYTLSDPLSPHIVPTNATSDQLMTLSVEGGNVLAGNVTTTGTVEAATLKGDGSAITILNPSNLSSQVLLAKGGTGLNTVAENELLLGPASGTALTKLPPYVPAASNVEYPTSALSSAANSGETIAGVTYTTTASSNQYGEIWKAFDKTTPGHSTFWHSNENVYDGTSGVYTGSNSLGGVNGEWIKLQINAGGTGIAPTSVNITGRASYDNQAPDSWEILGSTNNTSWTSLLSSTVHATYNGGSGHFEAISGASAYTYLALVVKARGGTGQTAVVISEVRFFTTNPNSAKKFLRSSGTGIAWDDVSSDLQTITDGGATTTQTVAFNNTTTGLTSAGDIDIAATKQIDYAGDVLLKSSAGAVASLKVTNAIKLDPGPAAVTVPVAMTANSSGGNTASAGYGSTNAWKAFDGSDSTTYTSEQWAYNPSTDSYTSSQSLGGISGDWLKIQLASPIIPISVFVKGGAGTGAGSSTGVPDEWRILGSNDDTNWTQLHSSTTAVDQSSGTTESFINTTAYSYIAIVVTSVTQPGMGGWHWHLSRLSFTLPPPPSNNVLSINTTTGEIYDSGGQGGSTLDNIHEEGSNVAIGPSAASANLTVNTYGSNVLTVSGNVSADSITIGNLNVAASPFALDDVVSVNAGANVTANVLTLGGLVTSGNIDASNITISGNTTSQNITLTNTDISATISSGTITIDAREKSYGTAPLVVSTTDVSNLVFSNLITGAQIVVPILASGGDIKISKELTNVNFYAMTTDVSITQDKHALMTLSNLYGNIYMNAIGFA